MKEYKDITEQLSDIGIVANLEYDEEIKQPYFSIAAFDNIIHKIQYIYALVYDKELYFNFQEPGCPCEKKIWWKLDIKEISDKIYSRICRVDKKFYNVNENSIYQSFFNAERLNESNYKDFNISYILPKTELRSDIKYKNIIKEDALKKVMIFDSYYLTDKFKTTKNVAEFFNVSPQYIINIRSEYSFKIANWTKIYILHTLKYLKSYNSFKEYLLNFGILCSTVTDKKVFFILNTFFILLEPDYFAKTIIFNRLCYPEFNNLNLLEMKEKILNMYNMSKEDIEQIDKKFIKENLNKYYINSLLLNHLPVDGCVYVYNLYYLYKKLI